MCLFPSVWNICGIVVGHVVPGGEVPISGAPLLPSARTPCEKNAGFVHVVGCGVALCAVQVMLSLVVAYAAGVTAEDGCIGRLGYSSFCGPMPQDLHR
jgi:hypothetical protein